MYARTRKHLCLIMIRRKVLFGFVVVYFEVLSGFRLGSGINEMSVSGEAILNNQNNHLWSVQGHERMGYAK